MNATTTTTTTDAEKVAELFTQARAQAIEDFRGKFVGLPAVTVAGLEAAERALQSGGEVSIKFGRLLLRAGDIPASSRRRRLLAALAVWLPHASYEVRRQEEWFARSLVRKAAALTGGAATEAEVAGLIVLAALEARIAPGLRPASTRSGVRQ